MAQVIHRTALDFSSVITVSEKEIRALDALVGYGDDAFIKEFREKLGSAYIRDHEDGLRSFFTTVREQLLPALSDIDQARADLRAALDARELERQKRLLGAPK